MRHNVAFRKLGRPTAHRLAMFRNMAASLILHDRIETTLPKAKELRRFADQLVTLGKNGSLAARRQAARLVNDPTVLTKLFTTLAERYRERAGGYTRIVRLGLRHGDSASMAMIEYLPAEIASAAEKGTAKKKRATAKAAPKAAAKKPRAKKAA